MRAAKLTSRLPTKPKRVCTGSWDSKKLERPTGYRRPQASGSIETSAERGRNLRTRDTDTPPLTRDATRGEAFLRRKTHEVAESGFAQDHELRSESLRQFAAGMIYR